jgi:hypothetical protein
MQRPSSLEFIRLFECFVGHWVLEREIPGIASFSGAAEFTATSAPDVLAYAESGILAIASGHKASASRRLLYCRIGERLAIKDDDSIRRGTLLHLLAFGRPSVGDGWLAAGHRHCCGTDMYDLEMTIIAPDRFETRYRVQGPRKDYRMLTAYRRRS